MKKPRSQKRRIPDAYVQSVSLNGTRAEPVQISVSPAGQIEKSVTFNLCWWQVQALIGDLRKIAAVREQQLQSDIQHVKNAVL